MFTLRTIDDNIFMIIKKDSLQGDSFKRLPIEVYGFIQVEVLAKKKFGMSFMNISQEVFDSDQLLQLLEQAKKLALLQKKHF